MNNDAISRSAAIEALNQHSYETSYDYDKTVELLSDLPAVKIDGDTSDGYHTFNELYDHRAKLFSVIVRDHSELCWKSKLHHDGTMYDGMFIVGINTPQGQASYHYDIDPYWDMFRCKEMERAPEWDGHTPEEAINRIAALDAPVVHARWIPIKLYGRDHAIKCSACNNCDNPSKVPGRYCWQCGARMDGEADVHS